MTILRHLLVVLLTGIASATSARKLVAGALLGLFAASSPAGAGGTFFWIDPKEQLAVVYMAQTPGAIRPYYRRMIKALVAQALDN